MMLTYNDLRIEHGAEVTFILNEHKRHAHYGKIEIENDTQYIRFNGNSSGRQVPISEIYAAYPYDGTDDLHHKIFKDYLTEKVQSYIDGQYSSESDGAKERTIDIDYVMFTEFQRHLFEECYWNKEELNHVNWFGPSSCYYPVGWYKLGGTQNEESDEIGEAVDAAWQNWINGLRQNMFLGCITPNKTSYTYKG